ncbi:MAG: hypothetical protein ACOCXA_03600, partial [Planctomycetota bacterium]
SLIAFWPMWPEGAWPTPIGLGLIVVVILLNCHLGSVLAFWGLGEVLALLLSGPATAIGNGLADLARFAADIPPLYHSYWSHTGHLGLIILGSGFAVLAAITMFRLTQHFRAVWLPKLKERRRLIATGKIAGNTILIRLTLWFFDVD